MSMAATAFVIYVLMWIPVKFSSLISIALIAQYIVFSLWLDLYHIIIVYLAILCMLSLMMTEYSDNIKSPFTCNSVTGFYPLALWLMHIADMITCVYEIWRGRYSRILLAIRFDLNLFIFIMTMLVGDRVVCGQGGILLFRSKAIMFPI